MTTNGSGDGIYRFGGYRIDTACRELRHGDALVEIQPRAFDLLVYLVTQRERAVDKEELQDAIWPGMVVTETALTRAIMKARKAVGDDAQQQAVIRTVHGHGYRFVAELDTVGGDPSIPAQEAPPADRPTADISPPGETLAVAPAHDAPGARSTTDQTRPESGRRLLGITALVALMLLVVAAVLAWQYLRPAPVEDGPARIAVLPLVDETGNTELAWTRLGLMSQVSSQLAGDSRLAVVADGNVIGLAETLDWQGDLASPQSQALVEKLRSVYGATHLVALELRREGAALRLNLGLLRPDGALRQSTMVGDQPAGLAQGAVQILYGELLNAQARKAITNPVSSDTFHNEAYARGMDLVLKGRCADAVSYFHMLTEREPELFAPRFQYAACQRILGNNADAEVLLDALIDELRAGEPGRNLARALMTRGILYNRTGRLDESEASHQEALIIARDIEDRDLSAKILHNISIVYEDRGEFERASELLDLAVLEYRGAGRDTLPGQVYSARANLCMDRGELSEARDYLEQALDSFRAIGDLRNEAMMLNNTGYLLREMGRLEEAEDYHLRSLALREDIGDRVGVGRVYGQLSALYSTLGNYAQASTTARSAHAIALETGDKLYEGSALAQWGSAEQGLGERAAAREHFLQAREIFVGIQDHMRILQADLLLARLDLEDGNPGAAGETTTRVRDEAREASLPIPEIEAMELLGEIAEAVGDSSLAASRYREALAAVREANWEAKEAQISVRLLRILVANDDLQAAAPLAGALAGFTPTSDSLAARASYAHASGDSGTATSLMEQARAMAGSGWDEKSESELANYRAGQ